MGLADRLKAVTKKAEDTAAEHKEQIQQAVQKVGATADERTGGKYHEQIEKAGAKADAFVDGLKGADSGGEAPDAGVQGSDKPESAGGSGPEAG